MKKNIYALLCAVLLFSCNKELTNPKLSTNLNATNRPLSIISTGGKYNVLGYGYDVTGQYGSTSAVTNQVLNIALFDSLNANRVVFDNSTAQYTLSQSGSNAINLTHSLAISTKDSASFLGLFKGTISASYSDNYAFSSRFVYGYFNLMVRQQRIYLNTPENSLYNYLSPQFQQDVQNQTPQYIVSHYGTHVLTDCILGAKLEVLYRAETDNTNKKDAGSVGIDGGISVLGVKGKVSATLSYGSASISKNFNQSLHYETHGADPSKGLVSTLIYNGSADTTVTLNVANWQGSSTVANSELIDLTPGTLMPLYDFVQDPTKAAALKSYIISYINSNSITLLNDNFPTTTLYRFYNSKTGDHMLSNSVGEVSGVPNWSLDGAVGQIYTIPEPGLVPLYRYQLSDGTHFSTTNKNEEPNLQPEGITGYVDPSQGLGEIPVYRFFAKGKSVHGHIYTASQSEYNTLLASGNWSYEGITGYISQ
jgi:hypothetical protein